MWMLEILQNINRKINKTNMLARMFAADANYVVNKLLFNLTIKIPAC